MAKHETPGRSDEWYTPDFVFEALGEHFDMDVAAPLKAGCPSDRYCAFKLCEDSLALAWGGFIWMNPPFGGRGAIEPWLKKFFAHGNGIALTPDRTSAPWWQRAAPQADAVMFWAPKIHFIPGPGARASSPAQGTTLFASGARGVAALEHAALCGHGVLFKRNPK